MRQKITPAFSNALMFDQLPAVLVSRQLLLVINYLYLNAAAVVYKSIFMFYLHIQPFSLKTESAAAETIFFKQFSNSAALLT